jgi:hypothetical protein
MFFFQNLVTIKLKKHSLSTDWKNICPKKSPGLEQPNFGDGFSALVKSFSKKIIFLSTIPFLEIIKKWGKFSLKIAMFVHIVQAISSDIS